MKDSSAFSSPRYLILGTVNPQQRADLPGTIDAFYNQLQKSAQELGGQVHEECSSVVFGPWDFALFVTVPSAEALYGLMGRASQQGIHTETYLAPTIKIFAQASKSAWTRTGAQSPVEQRR